MLVGAMADPRASHAQPKTMPIIGLLHFASPSPFALYVLAFRQGLSETGYIEGKNLGIEFRWAEGRYELLPGLAVDLVSRRVDAIVAFGPPSARAAKNATSTIPSFFRAATRSGRDWSAVSPGRAATSRA
jgi:putative ABC transport system substrate-binding protein